MKDWLAAVQGGLLLLDPKTELLAHLVRKCQAYAK
jgi:hypothetical protein